MAYNTTPPSSTEVRKNSVVLDSNYRTLWGVIYAVIALVIVAGAAMLFMRDRSAMVPYAPNSTKVDSTTAPSE